MNEQQTLELNKRIAKIKKLDFAFNDATYNLIKDAVVVPCIAEMDKRFQKKHTITMRGGAGMNGSDTSAIEVRIPREREEGFWGALKAFFLPFKTVVRITIRGNGYWGCDYIDAYHDLAERMEYMYHRQIFPRLFR